MTQLEKLFDVRIKDLVDYSIIFKYGEYRLICHQAFVQEIIQIAEKFNIEFAEVFKFDYIKIRELWDAKP